MGDVVLFDEGANVPAHILARYGPDSSKVSNSDLSSGVSTGFPLLSYKGKVWHHVQGDTRTLIADAAGEPRSSIEVVIVKGNKNVSKIYYEGGYVEGSDARPTCYSHDGIEPALDATTRQHLKCAICPRNQWGSRTTESGAKGKECSDSRRLAVSAPEEIGNPMLLRIPAASLKDLVAYSDMLSRRNTPYHAVVTRVGFDHTVAYQKLTFKPVRWLTDAEMLEVEDVLESSVVASIIGDTATGVSAAAAGMDDIAGERPSTLDKLPAPKVATKGVGIVDEDDIAAVLAPAKKPDPAKVAAAVAKKAPAFGAAEAAAAMAEVVKETVKPIDPKAAKLAALKAELARMETEATEEAAVEAVAPKKNHDKLLTEADAELSEVLSFLDDE